MNEDNSAPSSFQSIRHPQIKTGRLESYIFTIICWLLTIGIWVFIILIIIMSIPEPKLTMENFYSYFHNTPLKKRKKIIYIVILSIIYIIYLILEFSSPIFRYLYNLKKQELYEEMISFIKKKPSFIIKCKCTKLNSNENAYNTYQFRYHSCRDISGLFTLNIEPIDKDKKKYIMLELNQEIQFADQQTILQYNNEKEKFLRRYRNNGLSGVTEEISIKSLKPYNMIKIQKDGSFFVNFIWYIIFTLLSFVEIYKLYIYYTSIYQKFTIRKKVSTNKDLNTESDYNIFNPQIKIFEKNSPVDSKIYNYLSTNSNGQNKRNQEANFINNYENDNDQDKTKSDDNRKNSINSRSKKIRNLGSNCETDEIFNKLRNSQKESLKK